MTKLHRIEHYSNRKRSCATVEKLRDTPCHICYLVAWKSCAIKLQVSHRSKNSLLENSPTQSSTGKEGSVIIEWLTVVEVGLLPQIQIHYNNLLWNMSTCGAVKRPVMSPMVTSSSHAYSNVSLSRGKSLCENIACPRTWRPDKARWPSCKWPCDSGRYIYHHDKQLHWKCH